MQRVHVRVIGPNHTTDAKQLTFNLELLAAAVPSYHQKKKQKKHKHKIREKMGAPFEFRSRLPKELIKELLLVIK